MKKFFVFLMAGLLLSPQVMASRARLLALGMDETDNEGSYYINDMRNIFLNAANVNDFANTAIFEWGGNGAAAGTGNTNGTIDVEAAPKGQGGFLMSTGSFVYGAYFGNESNTSSLLRTLGSSRFAAPAQYLATSDNQIDLFIGGEASFKWGGSLTYTSSKNEVADAKDHGYAIRLGGIWDNFNVFANISVGNKAEGNYLSAGLPGMPTAGTAGRHTFEGKLGFHVGGGYQVTEGGTVYAYIKKFDWDQTDSLAAAAERSVEGSFTTYSVGYGHIMEVGQGRIFTNVYLRQKDIEVKFATAASAKNFEAPLTFGYEAPATSWLSLRGSITQNLIGNMENDNYASLNLISAGGLAAEEFGQDTGGKKATMANSTTVAAGASLHFGKLTVDGMMATRNAGTLTLDNVFTRVAATYSF